MIASLTLKRFRSFPSGKVEFANPTFLVGRNGSGKSNLSDAFAFLAEAMASPLQTVFDRRGGISAVGNRSSARGRPADLGLGVVLRTDQFSAKYAFEIRATKPHGFEVLREQCIVEPRTGVRSWFHRDGAHFRSSAPSLQPAPEASALALPLVGGDARFGPVLHFLAGMRISRIEPAQLREMQDPDGGVRLRPGGQNAASVLREIERESSSDWQTLLEMLKSIVPGTIAVKAKPQGNKLTLQFTQDWGLRQPVRFQAYNMSDGTLRALGLLAAVFQRPTPSVLVIEEPEATIHPGALGAVLDLLRHASRRMQVVVTTHSPDVLDAKWIEDRHLRILTWEKGATGVGEVSEAVRESLNEHLMGAGEMLRANVLTPELVIDEAAVQPKLFEDFSP